MKINHLILENFYKIFGNLFTGNPKFRILNVHASKYGSLALWFQGKLPKIGIQTLISAVSGGVVTTQKSKTQLSIYMCT